METDRIEGIRKEELEACNVKKFSSTTIRNNDLWTLIGFAKIANQTKAEGQEWRELPAKDERRLNIEFEGSFL